MTAKEGCPVFSVHSLYTFAEKYPYWIGALFMAVGGFLLALGGKQYKVTMFLAGLGFIYIIVLGGIFVFLLPVNTPEWSVWVGIGISTLIGSVVGYGSAKWPRIGVMLISLLAGTAIGTILYMTVFITFLPDENSKLIMWGCIAGCALLITILCVALFDIATILGSAIIGSYLLVRGFGIIFGGYPNEFVIFEEIYHDRLNEMSPTFLMYVFLMAMLLIMSIILQLSNRTVNRDLYNYRRYDFKYRRV